MVGNINAISIRPVDIYPVNVYGTVNEPWLYALRRQIEPKDRAITDYTVDRIAKNCNLNEGHCYLFKGGFRVSPVYELAGIEVPRVKVLHMRGVISAFISASGKASRSLVFVPDKVVCECKPDYDMLSVRAHDSFAETGDLFAFSTAIKKNFPEFVIDWMDQYPKVDVMPIQRGLGEHYAAALNALVTWRTCAFRRVYIEMGENTYTVDLK